MYQFKIKQIITNDGTVVIPKMVNLIIGPNSAGKSQFLKDIKNTFQQEMGNFVPKIVISKMNYELPHEKEEFIERYSLKERIFKSQHDQIYIRNYSGLSRLNFEMDSNLNSYLDGNNIFIPFNWEDELERQISSFNQTNQSPYSEILSHGNFSENAVICHETYVEDIVNGEKVRTSLGICGENLNNSEYDSIQDFIRIYGELFFNYLGTEEKLLICKRQKRYGYQDQNTNFLSEIQHQSNVLKQLSFYTKKMFHSDLYLDRYSYGDKILFRVGDDFDFIRHAKKENNEVERLLSQYKMLDMDGDGLKSFVANFLALHMNDKNILLLDEADSHLHPPLAKQLGEIVGQTANPNRQIFASTHEVDFLKGILDTCLDVNIIRITNNGKLNSVSQLEQEYLFSILKNPLLASSHILNGLFCEKVYICEAESDEQVYLSLHNKVSLSDSALFVHGKNKQTLKDIANVYQKLKVPCYRIYDFDLLLDEDFNRALTGFVEEKEKKSYIELRKKINLAITKKEDYHTKGVRAIQDKTLQKDVLNMLNSLKKKGIIIWKNGCLETTLEDQNIPFTKNKNKWFEDALYYIMDCSASRIKKSEIYRYLYE